MSIKRNSASYIILTIIESSVDGFIKLQDFRQHPSAYLYASGRNLPKSTISRAIKRLKEGGFVKEEKIGDEVILKLLKTTNYITIKNSDKNWDGKYRIISFDIPEQKRVVRNLLRRNLKKWGFKHLHKSVWVSKNDVYQKLINYVQELKIDRWVTIIEADKISSKIP